MSFDTLLGQWLLHNIYVAIRANEYQLKANVQQIYCCYLCLVFVQYDDLNTDVQNEIIENSVYHVLHKSIKVVINFIQIRYFPIDFNRIGCEFSSDFLVK